MPNAKLTDMDFMAHACHLSLKARGKTSPNPMVGAVITRNNRIIAEGWHKCCGGKHAEVDALNKAKGSVKGARMYVTLEPCHHHGRTPPCVNQIIESGIKEVVIGMKDPNPLTNGKSIAKLRRAGIKTKVGVLASELAIVNEAFIKFVKKRMPFVVAKAAQTLDGKIATSSGHSKWITSKALRGYARTVRDEFDAILVGINTVIKDNPKLSGASKNKKIKKVIVDTQLKIPLKARLFTGCSKDDIIVATTKMSSARKRNTLLAKGVQVLVCPRVSGGVDLKWLFKNLARQEITSILIEGGAGVIGSALRQNVVDKMHLYIAPTILGDENALASVTGHRPRRVQDGVRLKSVNYMSVGDELLVTGYV